jgi:phosphatidylglycerophosphate synthase
MSVPENVVVLADDSAEWIIAGLRQLDRIALALDEYARRSSSSITLFVVWASTVPKERRWLPGSRGSVRIVQSVASTTPSGAPVFTTHYLPIRGQVEPLLQSVPTVLPNEIPVVSENPCGAIIITDKTDIAQAEKSFLRRSGKSQDGPVSRFLNRHLSRAVTRVLLQFNVTPTGFTIALMILPVLAALFLLRGDYGSVAAGAGLFQLFSMLDGCDGEIARAKFLESKQGERIDFLSDLVGSLLFVITLGFGLSRVADGGEAYRWEGILCALVIALNEFGLRLSASHRESLSAAARSDTLYPRHQAMIQHSGLAFFGERFVSMLVQFTKRDVAVLFFFLLALANLPQWILHIWLGVTIVNLFLTAIAALNVRRERA